MKELDENIEKFNRNYMILNDYLEDAADRLHQISSAATEVSLTVVTEVRLCLIVLNVLKILRNSTEII